MQPDFDLLNSQDFIADDSQKLSIQEIHLQNENLALKETIRRNARLLEAILSNSREGIAITGPDRRIVRVFNGLTGIDKNSFPGYLVDSLVVPEDQEIIVDAYRRILTERSPKVQIVVRLLKANGVPGVYLATITDMLDDPDVTGIVWNYSEPSALPPGPPTSGFKLAATEVRPETSDKGVDAESF